MSLKIDLPDDLAAQLEREAQRLGVDARQYAQQMIREHMPAAERSKALRALFDQWATEDATNDPEELARRQRKWNELKESLNANRTSGRKLF